MFGPLKMKAMAKRPLAIPPQIARVLKLVDEAKDSEEPEEPPLKKKKKKKKMMRVAEATTLVNIVQGQLASFLGDRRRIGPKQVMKTVEEAKAFITNELVAVKPLLAQLGPP
jgi:hypothetical protein